VTEFAGGLPGADIKSDTATAASIANATSQAISTPTLMGKAYVRKRGMEITISLFKQCMPIPRWFLMKGKFGRQEFKELAGSDVDAELRFEVVKNSELTRTIYDIRKDLNEFYAQFGGIMGFLEARKTFPREVSEIAKQWNVNIEDEDYDAISSICTKRIGQMKAGLGQTQDPLELVGFIQPPVSALEPQLELKSKWLQEYLDTDEGQDAPMPLRLAVEQLIQGNFTGATVQQAAIAGAQGVISAAGQAPEAIGQKLLEGGQEQEPEPQVSPDVQLKTEADAQNAERQSVEADKAREHEQNQTLLQQRDQREEKALQRAHELSKLKLELASREKVAAKQRSAANARA